MPDTHGHVTISNAAAGAMITGAAAA